MYKVTFKIVNEKAKTMRIIERITFKPSAMPTANSDEEIYAIAYNRCTAKHYGIKANIWTVV